MDNETENTTTGERGLDMTMLLIAMLLFTSCPSGGFFSSQDYYSTLETADKAKRKAGVGMTLGIVGTAGAVAAIATAVLTACLA
jgi:hypothetical protein